MHLKLPTHPVIVEPEPSTPRLEILGALLYEPLIRGPSTCLLTWLSSARSCVSVSRHSHKEILLHPKHGSPSRK